MTTTESTAQGRRTRPRHKSLRLGRIVYNNATCTADCRIVSLSETGAGLELSALIALPASFVLEIRNAPAYRCAMRWRRGERLGVEFLGPPGSGRG
jgi:hypothetical protein